MSSREGPAQPEHAPTRPRAGSAEGARAPSEGPSFLAMIGLVAVGVALVIIVFFAIGYILGRLFL